MGALTTLGEVERAVEEFPFDPLPLRVEPAADAAARASISAAGLLLVGECHGVAENPRAVAALLDRYELPGLALEWPSDVRPAVEAFIADGRLNALAEHLLFWCGDGRLTAGHLCLLRALANRPGFRLALFDGPVSGADWSARDAAMAERLLARADVPTLVVAGNLHTRLAPHSRGVPMGAHVSRRRPGVRSVRVRYRGGGYFNLGLRTFREPADVAESTADLRLTPDGELALDLSRATPADVPFDPVLVRGR